MFMLVLLVSIILFIKLNDDSTTGPWKIESAALTTWLRAGYLPVFITWGQTGIHIVLYYFHVHIALCWYKVFHHDGQFLEAITSQ